MIYFNIYIGLNFIPEFKQYSHFQKYNYMNKKTPLQQNNTNCKNITH